MRVFYRILSVELERYSNFAFQDVLSNTGCLVIQYPIPLDVLGPVLQYLTDLAAQDSLSIVPEVEETGANLNSGPGDRVLALVGMVFFVMAILTAFWYRNQV